MYRFLIFIFFTIILCSDISGQRRFKAGLTLGVNASQINGDDYAGFDKLGLMGGLKASAILGEKTEFGIELLFSQRGSSSSFLPDSGIAPVRIHLDYVEAPLTFTFKDWEAEDFYRIHVHGGFSYGRLIGGTSGVTDAPVEGFNDNDFAVLVGVSYFTNEHLAFCFRYNRSMIPMIPKTSASRGRYWGFFMTFNTTYIF